MAVESLPIVPAAQLAHGQPEQRWLIKDLWGLGAQGIIGGAPKLGKSWLGLDMAISVASGTDCLGHFEVTAPGRSLVYLAEDTASDVRDRIAAICTHRGLDIDRLNLHVITAPVLRLDRQTDRQRLAAALATHKPRLLVLDPLVRLHRLDENSAQEISGLLGCFTELSRRFGLALALVHHAAKKHRSRPGQALRGSSDLHAWGACNAYLGQRRKGLVLTLEHRAAPAPDPLRIELVSRPDGSATHLEVTGAASARRRRDGPSLTERTLAALRQADQPMLRKELRAQLRVNNSRLGDSLCRLEEGGQIERTRAGWRLAEPKR